VLLPGARQKAEHQPTGFFASFVKVKRMRLSSFEIDILRTLSRGETTNVSPAHRVRLEMIGLTRETPAGLMLTPVGERSTRLAPMIEHETYEPSERRVDVRGRKLASGRTLDRIT
jgi:hypothetical protein